MVPGASTATGLPADGRHRASSAPDPAHEIEIAAAQLRPLRGRPIEEHHRSVQHDFFDHTAFLYLFALAQTTLYPVKKSQDGAVFNFIFEIQGRSV